MSGGRQIAVDKAPGQRVGRNDLEFFVLGPLEVWRRGVPVPLGPPAQRGLLIALLLKPRRVVSADQLIDCLWQDRPPATAANLVQGYVSALRKVLEPDRPARGGLILQSHPKGYVLNASPEQIDAMRFEQFAEDARTLVDRQPRHALGLLAQALALWRGRALADVADHPFAQTEAIRLEDLRLQAQEDYFQAHLACGVHLEVLADLEAFVASHPFRERACAQLALALYRSGRQSDALQTLANTRKTLREELGIDPGRELQELERAILRQDSSLEPPERERTNLPSTRSSFVGRRRELNRLDELLARASLVTLTGPGGSGKTRLALEAARRWLETFPDGVWFIDLAALQEASLVGAEVAFILELRVEPQRSPVDTVRDFVGSKRMLFLLDNCEHVLGAVASLAERLLDGCPHLSILATSRHALEIPGEVVFHLPTLGVPRDQAPMDEIEASEAVQLFCDRAGAAYPAFSLTPGAAQQVADICRRLDGLPLAIELAAPFASVLSLKQIADGLNDRFRLLVAQGTTSPSRHQTVYAALSWSYDLLSRPERTLLDRLAVFAGGFSQEAAEAVGEGNGVDRGDVITLLTRLVTKSVVDRVADESEMPRYRILETIREFGLEHLQEDGEYEETRRRHARYFVELATRAATYFRSSGAPVWLARVNQDQENFRAALKWSFSGGDVDVGLRLVVALWWAWFLQGPLPEARMWVDTALSHSENADARTRMRLLNAGSGIAMSQGEFDRVVELSTAHLSLAQKEGVELELAEAREPVAVVAWARGDYATARRLLEEAITISRSLAEDWVASGELSLLARVLADQGEVELAQEKLDDALRRARDTGEPFAIALALDFAAQLALDQEDNDRATTLAERARVSYREVGYQEGIGSVLTILATAAVRDGQHDRAEDLYNKSLELMRRLGHAGAIPSCVEGLARVAHQKGDAPRAARLMGAADMLRRRIDAQLPASDWAEHERLLAGVHACLNDNDFRVEWDKGASMTLEELLSPGAVRTPEPN